MPGTDLHPAGSYYREAADGSYEFVGPDGTVWGDTITPGDVIAMVLEDMPAWTTAAEEESVDDDYERMV